MSAKCSNAVRSLRVLARINLRQARAAKQQGRLKQACYHLKTALECRMDANSLRTTAR